MIKYKTSEDNSDYIVMTDPILFLYYLKNNYYCGNDIIKNAADSYKKLVAELGESERYFKDLAIKKDSDLGRHICIDVNGILFKNLDENIEFGDVVSAYNISVMSKNSIEPYLKELKEKGISGKTAEIEKIYGENITNYILNNRDFDRYIRIKNGQYEPKDSIVYDGYFHTANLYKLKESKQKIKNAKNNI